MYRLIHKAAEQHSLNREELIALLRNDEINRQLFETADEVRRQYVGDGIHLRGLIEFSNFCRNNCRYCGLRRDNFNIERYRIDEDTIFKLAEHAAVNMKLRTVVLQSGEDLHFTVEKLCNVIRRIKSLGVALTLSIGEKSFEEYRAYREAGADRFYYGSKPPTNNFISTTIPGWTGNNAPTVSAISDAPALKSAPAFWSDCRDKNRNVCRRHFVFKQVNADMIGIGPFIPHPDTPLKTASGGTLTMALKVMALTRLLLPDINIPATTAMETLAENGQAMALKAGANVIMPNVTLTQYRKHYELYPGKSTTGYTPDESLKAVKEKNCRSGTLCRRRLRISPSKR